MRTPSIPRHPARRLVHDRDRAGRMRRRRRCDVDDATRCGCNDGSPRQHGGRGDDGGGRHHDRATVKVTTTTAAITTTTPAPPRRELPRPPRPTTAPPAVPTRRRRASSRCSSRASRRRRRKPSPLPDGSVVDLVLVSYQRDDVYVATAGSQHPDGYVIDAPWHCRGPRTGGRQHRGNLISSEDITLRVAPASGSRLPRRRRHRAAAVYSTASCSTSKASAER